MSCFFSPQLLLEFFPIAELHLGNPPQLCYICSSTLCGNTEDSRQRFPACISNSLFLLLHFQAAPWAGSQTSSREGQQSLSQPHACPQWASHSALPSSPTSSSCCLLRNLLWDWWGFSRDMLQPKHLHVGSCLRLWLVLWQTQVTLSICVYGTAKLLFSFIDCFGLNTNY